MRLGEHMKILFCSGEALPFSKTGGLADVSMALPKMLKKLGHEIKIITPLYKKIQTENHDLQSLGTRTVRMGTDVYSASYFETIYNDVPYIFVQNDVFFNRPDFYGYADDEERFTFFNFAILEYFALVDDYADILHTNDWQTGMVPFLLDANYRHLNDGYKRVKTLLSIHNLEKQGSYPLETEKLFNNKNYTYVHLNRVNFLKCGIMRANAVNTVSETYKNEIMTRFYGFTLDGPLKSRKYQLFGILNGLDKDLYDPEANPLLAKNYTKETASTGKQVNKNKLIKRLGLTQNLPLIAFNARLARQKGIDIMMTVLESYLEEKAFNLVVIGQGDPIYESYFQSIAKNYPELVYYEASFDQELSQLAYAGSDLFMMPSLFEPCGLNHMIAMRYGSLPIVRQTGGLKDTVIPHQEKNGYGFVFANYDADEFKDAINQSLNIYHNQKKVWKQLIHFAMTVHFGLTNMAKQYEKLYQQILNDEL